MSEKFQPVDEYLRGNRPEEEPESTEEINVDTTI